MLQAFCDKCAHRLSIKGIKILGWNVFRSETCPKCLMFKEYASRIRVYGYFPPHTIISWICSYLAENPKDIVIIDGDLRIIIIYRKETVIRKAYYDEIMEEVAYETV